MIAAINYKSFSMAYLFKFIEICTPVHTGYTGQKWDGSSTNKLKIIGE